MQFVRPPLCSVETQCECPQRNCLVSEVVFLGQWPCLNVAGRHVAHGTRRIVSVEAAIFPQFQNHAHQTHRHTYPVSLCDKSSVATLNNTVTRCDNRAFFISLSLGPRSRQAMDLQRRYRSTRNATHWLSQCSDNLRARFAVSKLMLRFRL
jgi:hypothetical protein